MALSNDTMMIKVLKEPLVQFLVAGALIFGAYSLTQKDAPDPADLITVTVAEQKNLSALFRKTWQRAPTPAELDQLIDHRLGEELLYREALALGLDKDDVVVRRRLAQKIEFIADDLTARRDPSDEELESYLKANASKYSTSPSLTFQQVYLNADRRGASFVDDAKAVLEKLKSGADFKTLGDASLLPRAMEKAPISAVARTFGKVFAKSIKGAKLGEWVGPVRSSFGAHLILITARQDGRLLTLKEARSAVERDWREVQRKKARATYRKALESKYRIVIEKAEKQS